MKESKNAYDFVQDIATYISKADVTDECRELSVKIISLTAIETWIDQSSTHKTLEIIYPASDRRTIKLTAEFITNH